MADESLRMPSVLFRAVFDLGNIAALPLRALPAGFERPNLMADWDDDEDRSLSVTVGFDSGELHIIIEDGEPAFHFHGPGEESESPWGTRETAAIVAWAMRLTALVRDLDDLEDTVDDAADWYDSGLLIYVPETEPVALELIEVLITGELMTLPWLGSGEIEHAHGDDENHSIALLWNPDGPEEDRIIATASEDLETGTTLVTASAGVDWAAVGLDASEVLHWFEAFYENHHSSLSPEEQIMQMVLERLGGLS
jgi:hypothetical protein